MAWRIHESVIRGEIDNREKDRVVGKLWIEGYDDPVELDLVGNAHPDLAGCLLKFSNSSEPVRVHPEDGVAPIQKGTAGDMTASRKVRVFDIPVEEAYIMAKRGEAPPEHMANSLYLEWFSDFNGRVVVESADYELEISAPEWRLTEKENEERAQAASEGMSNFMGQLTDALEHAQSKVNYEKDDWDEFDYEKFMQESDARTDKYMELLDKYGDSEEGEKIIAKEMNWDSEEEAEATDAVFDFDEDEAHELEPMAETEGVDWIRNDEGHVVHPLQHRCFKDAMRLWDEADDAESNDQFSDLITGYQILSAKLAGALNSLAYGIHDDDSAFTVACLKRALNVLHKTQEALETPAVTSSLPDEIVTRVRKELFQLREDIIALMNRFRGRAD
ncbi:MAG: hypothetical protein CMO80_20490 [Verrucomicrobiales bacterium]|nr:hypothetical protein [Verrucomicrobiales bacterium]